MLTVPFVRQKTLENSQQKGAKTSPLLVSRFKKIFLD
jgi:hypothetical protein